MKYTQCSLFESVFLISLRGLSPKGSDATLLQCWMKLMESESLVDLWRKHRMGMEVYGFGCDFTRCNGQGSG